MMKKVCLFFSLALVMAGVAFAQDRDSRFIAQKDGQDASAVVYHLEVWDQQGNITDIGPFLQKLNELRRYGAVGFFIHGLDGYIVALYAHPDWTSQLPKPNGVVSKYTLVGDARAIIREALDNKTFQQYITRAQFKTDLNTVYNGLK